MNRPKFLLYPLGLLVLSAGIVWAGQTTMTTYYPSPTGNYNQLTSNYVSIGTSTMGQSLVVMPGGGGTGNVGIGTINPTSKLSVDDSQGTSTSQRVTAVFNFGQLEDMGRSDGMIIAGQLGATNPYTSSLALSNTGSIGNPIRLSFADRGTDTTPATITAAMNGPTITTGGWMSLSTNNGIGMQEGMRIDKSGNVGIGTTNPEKALDVNGTLRVQSTGAHVDLAFGSSAGGDYSGISRVSSTNDMAFNYYNGSWNTAMTILNSNGNVGIGTTLPGGKVHVFTASSGTTAPAGRTDLIIEGTSASGVGASILIPNSTSAYYGFSTPNSNTEGSVGYFGSTYGTPNYQSSMVFRVNSADVMMINKNGNVGIGNVTPHKILDVNGTALVSGTTGVGGSGGDGLFLLSNPGGESNIDSYSDSLGYKSLLLAGSIVRIQTGVAVERFRIDSNGNVGIGMTDPGELLDVNGNILAAGTITATSDARLKQNIVPLTGTLSKLDQLRGVSFEWNHLSASMGHKEGEKAIGIIAQELQKVYPELVIASKNGHQEYLSIDYGKFTAVLLQSVKELKSQTNAMQDQINVLQEKVKMLEKQK